MDRSPTADLRRLDAAMCVELLAVLGFTAWLRPAWWPAAGAAGAAGALLLWRLRGSPAAAWGLTTLLVAATVSLAVALGPRPASLAVLPLLVAQLPLYRNWALAAAGGAALAAAPLLLPLTPDWVDRIACAAALAAHAAFIAWRARVISHFMKVLFDVEFLVRAMGRSGHIRLDLDVLRAETQTGQRLKDVQDRVAQTLVQVRRSAQAAGSAADTLQASGQVLTDRTQGADRELSDAAMTLEQIAVIVKDSADAAMAARKTAQAATDLAREVGGTVGEMVSQMRAIDAGSQRITDIIGVIDGIAFQTNLLALNAAVEAARAGPHGRGFAVVATEVRTLARRVTQSAGEIKALIDESVKASGEGNLLARKVGDTMNRLVTAVMQVDSTFNSLSDDTNEHAAGLVTMRDTIFQLRDATRQNLALAEQAQDIAGTLAGRARELDEALSAFRLAGDAAAPPPSAGPVAAAAALSAASPAAPAGATGAAGSRMPAAAPPRAGTPAAPAASPAQADTVEFF